MTRLDMIIQSFRRLWLLCLLSGHVPLPFAFISFVHNDFLVVRRSPEHRTWRIFSQFAHLPEHVVGLFVAMGPTAPGQLFWGKQRCQSRNPSLHTSLRCAGSRARYPARKRAAMLTWWPFSKRLWKIRRYFPRI